MEVEARTVAKPRNRKENGVTVGLACHLVTVHPVQCSISPRTLFAQLRPFGIGGHTPYAAPVHLSGIVLRLQDSLVIGEALIAVTCLVAVLGEFVVSPIGVLVGLPLVVCFGFRLAPSVVVAIAFGRGGSHVASSPLQSAR